MNLDCLKTIDIAHRRSAEAQLSPSSGTFAFSTLNFSLAVMHVSANIFQLFILPVYFLPRSTWWSLFLVPLAALNNPFWALIHETIHDLFNSSSRINLAIGRLLSIFFGAPFHVLRLTHLSHHKFNRSPLEKGTEIYDPEKVSRIKASFEYFFYILCGLYLLEVFSTLFFFLPPNVFRKLRQRLVDRGNVQEKWLAKKFMDDDLIREIRVDGIAIGVIFGLSGFCYREHWQLFVSLLMARTFLISFMDNVYHYRTSLHATISGHNLSLPRFFSALLLHFNLHRVHHRNPGVPWTKLPEVFAHHSERFDCNFFSAAIDQLYGPIPLADLPGSAASNKKYQPFENSR
jgi:fatty acid desaturase